MHDSWVAPNLCRRESKCWRTLIAQLARGSPAASAPRWRSADIVGEAKGHGRLIGGSTASCLREEGFLHLGIALGAAGGQARPDGLDARSIGGIEARARIAGP